MTKVQTEININAPVDRVYEFYTNPDNIKEVWPVVKESGSTTGANNEQGSEMRVADEQIGIRKEMRLQVAEKEQNRRLVTRQTDGPFKRWESVQEFQGDNNRTHVSHIIDFELPTGGKVADMFTCGRADDRIRSGMEQAAQTIKRKLEG
ncbi:MAG TPA: SRPBCC family protein [Nitrososphaera sp.]|jgi:ligand-binding SRPBCC domain-containing protein|nr:SRPBCC family protein [Nitrososphaera sp.]